MTFYFTRRKYDAASNTFTKNIGPDTSYVHVPKENSNSGHKIGQTDWLHKISDVMTVSEILIFVHGFNTSQNTMLTRLRKLQKGLRANGFQGLVVGYSWPNRERLTGYGADRADVPRIGASLLTHGIQPIQSIAKRPKVHVLCHSMGAYVFLNSLSNLTTAQNIGELAFVAADIDDSWMRPGEPAETVVKDHTVRLTNYYSPIDRVLDLSATWIHGEPRVGGVGLSRLARPMQQDVACSNRYQKRPVPPKKTRKNSHVWYFDDAVWMKDLAQVLKGTSPNQITTRLQSTMPPDQVLQP